MTDTLDLSSLVIGAVLTLLVSMATFRYQHRKEIGRDAAAKKREILEKVAMEIATYISAPTAYSHALGVYLAIEPTRAQPIADRSSLSADSAEILASEKTGLISESWRRTDESGVAPVRAALDNLCEAHQQLARAIYWASLTADAALGNALQEFWTVANMSYLMFRRRFVDIEIPALNELMERLSIRSEAVRDELGRAYTATFKP